MSVVPTIDARGAPFRLDEMDAYRRWRDQKLHEYPCSIDQIVVAVADPRRLSEAESQALIARLRKTNMAIYVSGTGADPDKAIPRALGEQLGLHRLKRNWLADDDGITSLAVNPEGEHPHYIPYTDRSIKWHTDGYYNAPDQQIYGMMLHCVHPAAEGGENGLLDPEIVYIRLRDEDPAYIRALMAPDVMTIPPGTDMSGRPRGAVSGPVFEITAGGHLHMRYTARKRNIEWKDDAASVAAVQRLEQLLESDLPEVYRVRLESGMGLICNNVLHDRMAFRDSPASPRLLYRARYHERVATT